MEISVIITICLLVGSISYAVFSRNTAMWLLPIFIIGNNALGFADDYFLSIPGVYNVKDIAFAALFLFALVRLWAFKKFAYNKVMVVFYALIIFFFVQLLISIVKYGNIEATLVVFRKQIYYLSFLFSCIIFSSVSRSEFYRFLKVFFTLLFIQSFMYVLKSTTGINYFGVDDFHVIARGEVEIVRNFRAFPNYIFLLIVFCTVFIRNSYVKYSLLLLIFLTIFFSYTRQWLLLGIFFAAASDFFRKSLFRHRLKVMVRYFTIMLVGILAFQALFSESFNYFIERLAKLQEDGLGDSSFNIRVEMVGAGIDYIFSHDPFFGIGYIKRSAFSHTYNVKNFGSEMGDAAWGNLVVQYGIIGNLILWLFIFLMLREAIRFYRMCPHEKKWITIFIILAFAILPLHSMLTNVLQLPSPVSYLPWALFFVERFDYWEKEKLNG